MSRILINSFSGISPVTPARFLEPTQAQIALNADVFYGTLDSLKDVAEDDGGYFAEDYNDADYAESTDVNELTGVVANSIYLFGTQVATRKWFHWATDVDVVRGFIAGDTLERTFFTGGGGGRPQATDTVLNPGPAPYPNTSYDLGLPVPTVAPITAIAGAPTGTLAENRVYTYTWVNQWGDESAPYSADPIAASAYITVLPGETVNVTLPTSVAGNFDVTNKRIYRSVSGSTSETNFLFVAEVTQATSLYNDAIQAIDLGEVLPSIFWLPPIDDLIGIVALAGGFMAGFDGHDVYLSDPYHPYAWPIAYQQTMDSAVVGLGAADTTLFILTEGQPVMLQGSHPDSMTLVGPQDVHQACVSKRSIVEIMGSVYYASPDGLVRISASGADIVTENFFTKQQWAELEPSTIHAYLDERRYVAFFQSAIHGDGGFVVDLRRGIFILHDIYVESGYNSLEADALFVAQTNFIKRWANGNKKAYQWKSKKFTMREETPFSTFRLDAEGDGVACKVYRDNVLVLNKTVTARKLEKLPAGKGKDWEIELTGTEEVFSVGIAEAAEELGDG